MERLWTAWARICALFRADSLDRDMDREMRAHVELLATEYEAAGRSPEEARMAAQRRFGNSVHLKERGRDVRGAGLLGDTLRDARYALRGFRRTPTFTAAVVLILAIGIGANTAIFSVVDRLLLGDLPYPESEQLVAVYESLPESPYNVAAPTNWVEWLRRSRSFSSLAAWSYGRATLTGAGDPEGLRGQQVSAEFFPLLGVEPALGRVFTAAEDRPGGERVVVLSHGLWQRKFGGDPDIIDRALEFNANPYRVVGIMPAGFRFLSANGPSAVDYWMPFALRRDPAPAGYFVFVVGRLESGVSVPAAQAEMSALADQIARERGVEPRSGVVVTGLRGDLSRDLRTSLLLLFAAVGALILLACFNVAGLLLARGVHRRQEMAIRFSLGAGRAAIVRQLLTEGLVLAGAGAGLGIVVSTWTVSGLVAVAPINVLETMDVGLDGRVLLYVLGLSLATAIAFTLVPALTAVRRSPRIHPAANRTHTRTNRLRQGLVVAQVALALILASGAGLLGRTLQGLLGGHIGVDARDVLSLPVALPAARYDARARVRFFREAVERLERLPGVQSAGAGRTQPVTGVAFTVPFHVDGTPELLPVDQAATTDTGRIATSLTRVAAPGYFRTLGVPLLGGRDFAPDDLRENAPPVFVVNQAFVRAYFPAADPLGKVITTPVIGADPPEMVEGRIVGVVGDVKEGSLRREAQPTFYSDHGHAPSESMALFVRAEPAQGLPQAAVRVIREMDPDVPVTPIWLEDLYASTVTRERMNAIVLGAFAATALLLAAFGLYGLLVYLVADRTREIGIRMALGAPSQGVLLDVIGQGMRLVIAGVVLGLAGALAFSRSLEGLLYGVAPYDPATFAPVVGLLLSVAAVAIWGPARRATRVDPLTALQDE